MTLRVEPNVSWINPTVNQESWINPINFLTAHRGARTSVVADAGRSVQRVSSGNSEPSLDRAGLTETVLESSPSGIPSRFLCSGSQLFSGGGVWGGGVFGNSKKPAGRG